MEGMCHTANIRFGILAIPPVKDELLMDVVQQANNSLKERCNANEVVHFIDTNLESADIKGTSLNIVAKRFSAYFASFSFKVKQSTYAKSVFCSLSQLHSLATIFPVSKLLVRMP